MEEEGVEADSGEEDEQSVDKEDDVEPDHMGGEGMDQLDQVVPAMDPVGGASGELYPLERSVGTCGPYKGMYGDYMGTDDVLKEVPGFDLEDEDLEEQTYIVSSKNLLSNYLHSHGEIPYFYVACCSFIENLFSKKIMYKLNNMIPS